MNGTAHRQTRRVPSADHTLALPGADGTKHRYRIGPASSPVASSPPPLSRTVYAAAHVVVDPLRDPSGPAEAGGVIDWDATLAFRHHLWSLGLGVAEAMDTAQRGSGLSWQQTKALIARSGTEARAVGGSVASGVVTDQLAPGTVPTLRDIAAAYLEQLGWAVDADTTPVLMASRHLAAAARGPQDYLDVYDQVLSQVDHPVLLHWLGEPVRRRDEHLLGQR